MLRKDLLAIMACPKCKGAIEQRAAFLVCGSCKLGYPILDGDVPDMLIDDAWPIGKARKAGFKHGLKL